MRSWPAIILIAIATGGCLDDYPAAPTSPFEDSAMTFVESLVVPETGLVASRSGECFTTVYKNALAAMAFLHQGNHGAAQAIFDRFETYRLGLPGSFKGFPKDWNPCTGLPTNDNRWEGDNAFLLLALNYYLVATNGSVGYKDLTNELVAWLVQRAQVCESIVAEGTANMYAALLPHASDPAVAAALTQLQSCFTDDVNYASVLDHTVRGSLVFQDYSGFSFLSNFRVTEPWVVTQEPIEAYAAFDAEPFANIEISAQLLLTATLTGRTDSVATLRSELEKTWIQTNHGREAGLPYFLSNIGFTQSAELGIIDPTVYMLFVYWRFNPFRPT